MNAKHGKHANLASRVPKKKDSGSKAPPSVASPIQSESKNSPTKPTNQTDAHSVNAKFESSNKQPSASNAQPQAKSSSPKQSRNAASQHTAATANMAAAGGVYSVNGGTAVLQPIGTTPVMGQMNQIDLNGAKTKKTHRALKIIGIILGIVVGVLAAVYFVGVLLFSNVFFPNTTIGNRDISFKTAGDVANMLDDSLRSYTVSIVGEGVDLELTSSEAGLSLDSDAISDGIMAEMDPWAWPVEIFEHHDQTDSLVTTVESNGLADSIRTTVNNLNANATAPVNATIAFDATTHQFEIVPEVYGTTIDVDKVISQVSGEITTLPTRITLNEDILLKPSIVAGDAILNETRQTANKLINTQFDLTAQGSTVYTLTPDLISQWVTINPDLSVTLNNELIHAWAKPLADSYDTAGSTRTYTRPDGVQITVSGGDYGWVVSSAELEKAVTDALWAGSTTPIELPYSQKASTWAGVGVPDWGNRYIDIDLSAQHVTLYDGGAVLWESDCVSGTNTDARRTPSGVYYIKSNGGASVLKGRNEDGSEYESPVSYWMPFIDNSIGLHDANWRGSFGGSIWQSNGSHGCVNLPVGAASELHELIQVGDPVVCHY